MENPGSQNVQAQENVQRAPSNRILANPGVGMAERIGQNSSPGQTAWSPPPAQTGWNPPPAQTGWNPPPAQTGWNPPPGPPTWNSPLGQTSWQPPPIQPIMYPAAGALMPTNPPLQLPDQHFNLWESSWTSGKFKSFCIVISILLELLGVTEMVLCVSMVAGLGNQMGFSIFLVSPYFYLTYAGNPEDSHSNIGWGIFLGIFVPLINYIAAGSCFLIAILRLDPKFCLASLVLSILGLVEACTGILFAFFIMIISVIASKEHPEYPTQALSGCAMRIVVVLVRYICFKCAIYLKRQLPCLQHQLAGQGFLDP